MKPEEIKKVVREGYSQIAGSGTPCCPSSGSCCGGPSRADAASQGVGYTGAEIDSVPQGSNLGLGCGNPLALASLREGETVLDLGSGAGFDCFLAAVMVGDRGRVIGVDMTPEMVARARENAAKGGYGNVEFRLGEIENLPLADNSVDVVISNCVINLSPDKAAVFKEAFRVLRPGGRLMVSDIVLAQELPEFIKQSPVAYVGCVSGAVQKETYLATIRGAGFHEARVLEERVFPVVLSADGRVASVVKGESGVVPAGTDTSLSLLSVSVQAIKPLSA